MTPGGQLGVASHVRGCDAEEHAPEESEAERHLANGARQHLAVELERLRRGQLDCADAFDAAARSGDFGALIATLDPDAVVRADYGPLLPAASQEAHGAETVARQAMLFRRFAPGARPALVNGAAGLVVFAGDEPYAMLAFTVRNERIAEIDILADPQRLARIDFAVLDA